MSQFAAHSPCPASTPAKIFISKASCFLHLYTSTSLYPHLLTLSQVIFFSQENFKMEHTQFLWDTTAIILMSFLFILTSESWQSSGDNIIIGRYLTQKWHRRIELFTPQPLLSEFSHSLDFR